MDPIEKNDKPKPHFRCRSQAEIMHETGREWKDSTTDERMEALEHLRQITYPNYSSNDRVQKIMTIGNLHDDSEALE